MSEEDVDERELREAEALARALARGSASDDLPEEALQAAALIRYSAGGGVLREDRQEAVLEEVLAAAERGAREKRGARREAAPIWRWLFGAVGLAAVAVLVLVIVAGPGEAAPTALPAPGPELIRAQLARLDDPAADARFEEAMASYRGEVYAALEARYGGR